VKNILLKFGFTLNIAATTLLLLASLAPLVPPDTFWPIAFFGLVYPCQFGFSHDLDCTAFKENVTATDCFISGL
jgi:hypothetical protein